MVRKPATTYHERLTTPWAPQAPEVSPGNRRSRLSSQATQKGGGRHRGGEWRPRARSGPGGGGRLRPINKLTCKVPPYATTSIGFATTGVYPPQVPVAASAQSELQHTPEGLSRPSARFPSGGSRALLPKYHLVRRSMSSPGSRVRLTRNSGHCPQTTAKTASALLSSRESRQQPAIDSAGPDPQSH